MAPEEEDTNEQFNEQFAEHHQPRCEIDKTLIAWPLAEGECQRLGEVRLDGRLLCAAHAELLRLGETLRSPAR